MSRDRLNRLDIVAALLSEHVVEPRWSLAATPLPEGDAMFVGAVALLSARPKALVPGVALGVLGDSTNSIVPLRALGNVADDGAQVKAELCALVDGALAAARGQPPPIRGRCLRWDIDCARGHSPHAACMSSSEAAAAMCTSYRVGGTASGVRDVARDQIDAGVPPAHGDPFTEALSDMKCDQCGERLLVGAWVCLHCKHDHGEENAAPPREEPTNG